MTIAQREKVPYICTPLIQSIDLTKIAPCRILLKQEFIQPSGSYKLRGISNHIKTEYSKIKNDPELRKKKIIVIAASGGNAGNAVSCASNFYGLKSIIVVPTCTSLKMKSKIEGNNSEVIMAGANIGEADSYVKEELIFKLSADEVAIYCHPYDHPAVWEGHSSLVDETVLQLTEMNQLHNLKGIICSIGGGGLYNGLVHGLRNNNLSKIPILTLETDSCPTFDKAIKAQKPVQMKTFKTIATSLACPYIALKSLENYNTHNTVHELVTDADAAKACCKFAEDFNIIVEPACGVALCGVYNNYLQKHNEFFGGLTKSDIIVVVVCGGSATTVDDLMRYEQAYNYKERK